jgi:hypothetical protein
VSNIQPYEVSGLLPSLSSGGRLGRQTSRELAQAGAAMSVGVARIEAAAELQAMKASATAHVARRAMQEVALVSQVETQLATAVPHASGRLAAIADMTAVAMTDVVMETAHRIGRCS